MIEVVEVVIPLAGAEVDDFLHRGTRIVLSIGHVTNPVLVIDMDRTHEIDQTILIIEDPTDR